MSKRIPREKSFTSLICLLVFTPLLYGGEFKKDGIDYADSCLTETFPESGEYLPLDEEPTINTQFTPKFPEMAEETGVRKADVWVRVLIDKCGNVRKSMIQIPSGSKCGFDQAALEAADKCKFNPGIIEGEPVACWVTYKFEFRTDLVTK